MAHLNNIENYLNNMVSNLQQPVCGGPVPSAGYIQDARIRFKVMGVYFWQDDIGWDNNGSSASLYNFNNYAVDPEHSLNVFFYGHNLPGGFGGRGQGLLGECTNVVTLQNLYTYYENDPPGTQDPLGGKPWVTHPLILHEIGHCLGLRHSYSSNSQFSDKPFETQCNFSDPNTTTNCSNNVMGYSSDKLYLSPEQIGHVHQLISGGWRGKLVESCTYSANETVYHSSGTTITWNYAKVIGGDLIISNNSTLIVKCKVSMPDFGKVVVEPGSRLIIDGGAFVNNCDGMWLGIDVQGNRNTYQNPLYQGVVEMKNGAIIEYARNGIRTIGTDGNDNKDWSKTGGIVRVYDGTFRNCRRGIEFLSYQNINVLGNEQSNTSFILNANFVTDEELPNGTIPYAGITMFEVRGIQIRNCIFENTRSDLATVEIDERGSGIYSIDANYRVSSSYDINSGSPNPGTENEFRDLYYGVYASGGTQLSDVIINDNSFDNCAFGVGLTGSNYGLIGRNQFEIKGGDGSPSLFGYGFGVYTEGAYGFDIEQNTFSSKDPNGLPDQAIHVNQSSDFTSGKVYLNNITNTTYGTQTIGNNGFLKVDCNTYTKGAISSIDIHNAGGDLANQGSCGSLAKDIPANNQFVGTCNGTNLSEIYNNGDPLSYRYQTATLNPSCTNLGTNAIQCFNNPNTCPTSPNLDLTGNVSKPVRINLEKQKIGEIKFEISFSKALLEEGDDDALISAINNQSGGQLKNLLISKSPYLSDRVIISYLQKPQQPNGHIKQIVIANSPVSSDVMGEVEALNLPNGIKNQINSAQTGISPRLELEENLEYLNKERLLSIDFVVREYIDSNWIDSAIVFLKDEGSIEAVCALVPLEIKKDPNSVMQHLTIIREKADEIELEKPEAPEVDAMRGFCDFHELLINVKSRPESYYSLGKNGMARLQEIASSNLAVSYNAKAILNFLEEKIPIYEGFDAYYPKSMTLEESAELLLETSNSFGFMASPNPTNGQIVFSFDKEIQENMTLVITNLQGKVIKTIPVGNQVVNFEFVNIPAGTYLAHLVVEGALDKTLKIIYAQ